MADNNQKTFSRPFVEQRVYLVSEEAQHVAERTGESVNHTLAAIAFALRQFTDEKHMNMIDDMIEAALDKLSAEIASEMARMKKLAADNGITINPGFTHPLCVTVRLNTPEAVAFYGLIHQFDALVCEFDRLLFGKVWKRDQRRQAAIEWQRRITDLAIEINQFKRRAWDAAEKKSKAEESQKVQAAGAPPKNTSPPALPTASDAPSADAAPSTPMPPLVPTAEDVPPRAEVAEADGKRAPRKKAVAV